MIKIAKGLNLPITGVPNKQISDGHKITHVALVADDYVGMKPSMLVKEGDAVKKGQPLFEDKKNPGVLFTAPAAGVVKAVNRGDRRAFQSVELTLSGNDQVSFQNYKKQDIEQYSRQAAVSLLTESGLWTTLRTRPFSKSPAIEAIPKAIFINAMDTNPLAVDPEVVLKERMTDFVAGVKVMALLSDKVWVVVAPNSQVNVSGIKGVKQEQFAGPHPAGNVGVHIHYLEPVSANKTVWHVNYQDCISIGKLFTSGELDMSRVISLAGPVATNPRYLRTVVGASLSDLTTREIIPGGETRVVTGSVFNGRKTAGVTGYLGRFHLQVTLLKEGHHREFLGWHSPGVNKFSIKPVFLSKLIPGKLFGFDTNLNGSHRSIVPIGSYEAVMPGDFLPTQLLRFLMSKNTDRSAELGALELDEEDLALCTFVDPCKNEFGPALRAVLNQVEKEG